MDAYIYQADIYCEPCAEKIVRSLERKGVEDTGDSDDFPQGVVSGGGESDSPHHCAKCNEFLENPLTSEGYAYVEEAAEERPRKWPVTEWVKYYLGSTSRSPRRRRRR